PHDSICGCSVDAVHDEMMVRFSRLHGVLDALDRRLSRSLFSSGPGASVMPPFSIATAMAVHPDAQPNSLVIWNLSAHKKSGPVKIAGAHERKGPPLLGNLPFQLIAKEERREECFVAAGAVPSFKEVELAEAWVFAEDVPAFGFSKLDLEAHQESDEDTPEVT